MPTPLAEESATKPPARTPDESFIVVRMLDRDDLLSAVFYVLC